ncbi:MAG: tetratricopeptide repeat protein [Candidatus Omnitrophica bacterium]|nr:tetratricopeptide repeat protein [Candidatus Omnitrophota bacterium]
MFFLIFALAGAAARGAEDNAPEEKTKTLRAANDFLREIILKVKRPGVLQDKALELVAQKKYREAARVYEEIVLSQPDDDETYLILGHTDLLAGDYEKAENAFYNAVHIDPENIGRITPFYENIAIQNPGDDTAYANLGYAYLVVGDAPKAAGAFQNALELNPENTPALQGLEILKNRGRQ